jgi:hypothetical protein
VLGVTLFPCTGTRSQLKLTPEASCLGRARCGRALKRCACLYSHRRHTLTAPCASSLAPPDAHAHRASDSGRLTRCPRCGRGLKPVRRARHMHTRARTALALAAAAPPLLGRSRSNLGARRAPCRHTRARQPARSPRPRLSLTMLGTRHKLRSALEGSLRRQRRYCAARRTSLRHHCPVGTAACSRSGGL